MKDEPTQMDIYQGTAEKILKVKPKLKSFTKLSYMKRAVMTTHYGVRINYEETNNA